MVTTNFSAAPATRQGGSRLRKNFRAVTGMARRAMRLCLPVLALLLGSSVSGIRAQTATDKPIIEVLSLREVSFAQNVVSFTVDISGDNFGSVASDLTGVQFVDQKGASVGTIREKSLFSNNKIVVKAEAPLGTTINTIRITTRGFTVEDTSFKLSLKEPAPPPKVAPFEIKHETLSSPDSPIKTLSISSEEGKFDSNPHRMSVELIPAGASNVLVRPGSNPHNLIVDFMAPEKYEVKDVVVTVYNSSDLDARAPTASSRPFKEKKPQADPNQPTISKVEVLYLQRNRGAGRLKIEGSGFGNYRRPKITAEEFISS